MDRLFKVCFKSGSAWSIILVIGLLLKIPVALADADNTPLQMNDHLKKIKSKIRSSQSDQPLITDSQRQNLRRLKENAEDSSAVKVVFNRKNGTPLLIKIKSPLNVKKQLKTQSLTQKETAAQQFLASNQQLLKLNNPDQDLSLAKSWSDQNGASHFKYQQMVGNIPVFGKQIIVHVDSSDSVYLLNGRFEPAPFAPETTPAITESEALESVKKHLDQTDLSARSSQLVFYTREDGRMVLTYKLEVAPKRTEAWTYFIDAADGSVVHRITKIHNETVPARGTDLNGELRSFNAWFQDGSFFLIDPTLPGPEVAGIDDYINSLQSPGNTYVLTANHGEENAYLISSPYQRTGWDEAGVSAMSHLRSIHAYYLNTFGRNGLDDNGMNYVAIVDVGFNPPNAAWNGNEILLGDGGNGTQLDNLANALDVMAHELQHGITSFTADLVYENQSGALNEAYSDIFACMVDDEDWRIGEDITIISPGFLRDVSDPTQGIESLPTSMSEYVDSPNTEAGDYGGVHINMSIASYAGYLMAEGLENSLGREAISQIWYQALTNYLTVYSQFADARSATIQAAEDLYDQNAAAVVQTAWDTVEVFEGSGSNGQSTDGNDIMIYLRPISDTQNNSEENQYDLFALVDPTSAAGQSQNIGPLNDTSDEANLPRATKSAAYTNSIGDTVIFYVTQDFDLHSVLLHADGTYEASEELFDSKAFYSIAVSPDGRYFAYTGPEESDDRIYILDLQGDQSTAFSITSMNTSMGNIIRPNALSFNLTGEKLIFDALVCQSADTSSCQEGEGGYYTTGLLTLYETPFDSGNINGTISSLPLDQTANDSFKNPAFAAGTDDIIAVDHIDHTQPLDNNSAILALDITTGEYSVAANMSRTGLNDIIPGAPSFWKNDSAVTIQRQPYANAPLSVYRVPLDDNWSGPESEDYQNSEEITALCDFNAVMPLMHSQARNSDGGEITFNTRSINFVDVTAKNTATQTLILSNSSDKEINIEEFILNGSESFTHNGTPGILAQGGRMMIEVSYTPKKKGSEAATLTIASDAEIPTSQISITGNAKKKSGSSGSSGGCMISTLKNSITGR